MPNLDSLIEQGPLDVKTGKLDYLLVDAAPKGKEPSILQRVAIAGQYGTDEERRARLAKLGYNPNYDKPFGQGGIRELAADYAESTWPFAAKTALQLGGEAAGGMTGGPAGFVAGGAAGSTAAQSGFENLAAATGLGNDEMTNARIAAAGGMGGITSGAGKALSKVIPAAREALSKIPAARKFAEWFDKTMSGALTKMPGDMYDWVKGRWTEIAKQPWFGKSGEAINDAVNNYVIEPLKRIKSTLGTAVTDAKAPIHLGEVIPDMTGLKDTTAQLIKDYAPNLTSVQRNNAAKMARTLEYITNPEKVATASPAVKAKIKDIFVKKMDQLVEMSSEISGAMGNISGKNTLQGLQAQQSFVAGMLDNIYTAAKAQDPALAEAMVKYADFQALKSAFEKSVGKDTTPIVRFLQSHMFSAGDPAPVIGQRAFNSLFGPGMLNPATRDTIKDIVAANWMKNVEIAPSGFKAMIPRKGFEVAGETLGKAAGLAGVGAGVGAVTGDDNRLKGAATGAMIGAGATIPYLAPSWNAFAHRIAETQVPKVSRFVSEGILKKTPQVLERLGVLGVQSSLEKKMSRPIGQAITDLEGQFGMKISPEEILNSRRKALIK